ncbi:MAG: transposase, partial [Candidatus Promineifilaceae bacterium]
RHLCRYIHANPVKDGIVHNVEDWPYSNYLEWIGLRHGSLVDRNFIEGVFGSADNYMEAVQDFLILKSLPVELGSYLR